MAFQVLSLVNASVIVRPSVVVSHNWRVTEDATGEYKQIIEVDGVLFIQQSLIRTSNDDCVRAKFLVRPKPIKCTPLVFGDSREPIDELFASIAISQGLLCVHDVL